MRERNGTTSPVNDTRPPSRVRFRGRRDATEEAQSWPEGVIARYLAVAGATVDITGSGDLLNYQCTGCPYGSSGWAAWVAHERAQEHAEKCRALPRPTT